MSETCRIRTVHQEANRLFFLELAPAESIPYGKVGQFAVVTVPSVEGRAYLAFANLPAEPLAFLVKDEGAVAIALCHLAPGDPLTIESVEGNGFDLTGTEGRRAVLVSMGSGLGPIRVLLRHALAGGWHPSSIVLLHGSFLAGDVPFHSEMDAWREAGVEVELCLDREPGGRNALVAFAVRDFDPDHTVVFWIGSKGFGAELREIALQKGLREDFVRSNT